MIPKECKRLAEVDFPIGVVSKHAAREKSSIRPGYPSTLHLWWARRPLAACRAMLLGLLLPDPCDEHCPENFKKEARELLPQVVGRIGHKDEDLRQMLLKVIGDFANWDLSDDRTYLEVTRGLVKAAHGDDAPLVVDPFAGGGSIPLEALRLGCETFASDLNPVACLILKTILKDIPSHGSALAQEFQRVAMEIKETTEKELTEFYPVDKDKDNATPIAYLWARTVRCESECGAEIPLVRSFWLCNKAKRKRALRCKVIRPNGRVPRVEFEVFVPKNDKEVPAGTVTQARASCPCCHVVLSRERVQAQLREQRGGVDVEFDQEGKRIGGARLIAVVSLSANAGGRQYRVASDRDYEIVWKASKALKKIASMKLSGGMSLVPDETFHNVRPSPNARGLSAVTRYGINKFAQLYTVRQLLALTVFCEQIRLRRHHSRPSETLLGLTLSRVADYCSAQSRWDVTQERNVNSFGRQALPMLWDFAELVPFRNCVGSWDSMRRGVAHVVERFQYLQSTANVQNADATEHPLPSETADVWFTDPPYYDSVPYADLSDFFYVWLRRILPDEPLLRNHFEPENPLTPKLRECVWNRAYIVNGKEKDPRFFEQCVGSAFAEARRLVRTGGIGCVVFAHKTTEGWEALLTGMIQARWVIVSSWPISTEQAQRLVARDSAALATSVHLVCRPRPDNAPIGDWADVLRELPNRIGDWMERLSSEGVRGADLVFACIGPAMEVYSRYSKVEDAEGREIPLGGDPTAAEPYKRGFLAYVWETVGRTALQQVLGTAEARARNGVAGALEEDARLTALFLWTLQATDGEAAKTNGKEVDEGDETDNEEEDGGKRAKKRGFTLIYDVARRFAQPLGIHLNQWEGRIIEIEKGIVRLLPVSERAEQLFGEESASAVADRIEANPTGPIQANLFSEEFGAAPEIKGRGRGKKASTADVSDEKLASRREATTLDRIHAAMLLQASGRANALRALLKAEQERGPDFLRLANALSALYPKASEEKRLLDALVLAIPR